MSRQDVATTTGAVVMLSAALLAGAIVWVLTTDPMGMAAMATAADVPTLLARVASRVVGMF